MDTVRQLEQTYEIHIRSSEVTQQKDGFNTNFTVELEAGISRQEGMEMHLSVSSAAIPWSWYSFCAHLGTNQLLVDGFSISGLTLVDGNYDIYELVAAINADASFKYDASFDVNSLKITLVNNNSTEYTINFSSTASQGLAKAMGFNTQVDKTIAAGGSITSDNAVNLQTIHSLFFHSRKLSVANVITTQLGNFETILDKIPLVNVAPSGIIHYDPYQTAPFRAVLNQSELKMFDISIRDQNGLLLQLNGCEYEMTLLVEIKYPQSRPKQNLRPARRINRDDGSTRPGPPPVPALVSSLPANKRRAVMSTSSSVDEDLNASDVVKPPVVDLGMKETSGGGGVATRVHHTDLDTVIKPPVVDLSEANDESNQISEAMDYLEDIM